MDCTINRLGVDSNVYTLCFRLVVYLVHCVEGGSSTSMYDEDGMSHTFLIKRPLVITTTIVYHMSITYT
jgi:hypothetical protein